VLVMSLLPIVQAQTPPVVTRHDQHVEVTLPVPVARPRPGDVAFCYSVSPSLGNRHTVIEVNGIEVHCGSTRYATVLCVRVPEAEPWPDDLWATTCEGRGRSVRASFVPGHDPGDELRDGVDVVRVDGPEGLSRDRAVTFATPGWPDALGRMPEGACEVRDGRLTLLFTEHPERARTRCHLGPPIDRRVVVRLRDSGWRPSDR